MAESLEKKVERLDRSLQALRKQVAGQGTELRHGMQGARLGLVASTFVGALLALTAAEWGTERGEYANHAQTLWSLVEQGWSGVVTLVLVAAVGIGTLATAASASRGGHIAATVLSVALALSVLFVFSAFEVDDTDGPGRWLTLVVALALAVLHGTRAADLRGHR
jgi:hypothetical protein